MLTLGWKVSAEQFGPADPLRYDSFICTSGKGAERYREALLPAHLAKIRVYAGDIPPRLR